MTFRALNTEFDEVVIIDLLPESERIRWRITEDLEKDLTSLRFPQYTISCASKKDVFDAFEWCVKHVKEKNFILQFTAHGNQSGIGLKATSEFIAWKELRPGLTQLNSAMSGNLILNMVACKGIYGTDIQLLEDPADPFFGIVGPLHNIEVAQAKRVSTAFYKEMVTATEIPSIVAGINKAEGSNVLWCISSQMRRQRSGQELAFKA